MHDFKGKMAFITGGASGIGLGQAQVFSQVGAKVVLADIRPDRIELALAWFHDRGLPAHGIHLDVTDRAAFERAADEAERVFGAIDLLFNTAGVAAFGPLHKASYADYDWIMGVNFGGVVNGIQTFVPRMIARGCGGHVVNTASVAAFYGSDVAGIYCASKFAVRGLSEALHQSLAKYGIGVSILCPANVNTRIPESGTTRPAHLRGGYEMDETLLVSLRKLHKRGMDPEVLAKHVKTAIERGDLYVIPFPEEREPLSRSFARILECIPPESSDPAGIAARRAAAAEFARERQAQRPAR
jgi:NAD(P)-dependent dehydrogenase (short-subunit alcohol dehydrogenase family)